MLDVWVHRDATRTVRGDDAKLDLFRRIDAMRESTGDRRRALAIEALVAAGEIESALADACEPTCATIAKLTDTLAAISLHDGDAGLADAMRGVVVMTLPRKIEVSAPEGFAFYALHPEAYALAARELATDDVLVVGIRSIGTTLSAIFRAALGDRAKRCTVRPEGPPFDRVLASSPAFPREKTVAIVDEGPGLSGSTFLAVAEAFVQTGVSARDIVLVCSHAPDPAKLRAPAAAERWRAFRTIVAPATPRVPADGDDLSGGAWRALHFRDPSRWPASFISAERRKVLVEKKTLLKYEGMGATASAARQRGDALAKEGFVPPSANAGDGWLAYPWRGKPIAPGAIDGPLVDRIALLCARRVLLFPADDATDLDPVLAKNRAALGLEPDRSVHVPPKLPLERPTIVDARMDPHEWLVLDDGRILKTDAIAHGDDHFMPGPTDIAWDLAGAIVEWELDGRMRARLLDTYRRASGDDIAPRIVPWLSAYAVGRAAHATFARDALRGTDEEPRFARSIAGYLNAARALQSGGGELWKTRGVRGV